MSRTVRQEAMRRLEHELTVLRRRVKRVVRARAKAVHPDLQQAGYYMLVWILENGPVRASELVEEFEIDKGAVSRQVQHLCELGLVLREPDPTDGRASLVSASQDTVDRMERIAAERRQWAAEQIADWADDDVVALVEGLHRYNDALENAAESDEQYLAER